MGEVGGGKGISCVRACVCECVGVHDTSRNILLLIYRQDAVIVRGVVKIAGGVKEDHINSYLGLMSIPSHVWT